MLDNDVDFGGAFDRPLKSLAWDVACREYPNLERSTIRELNLVHVVVNLQYLTDSQNLAIECQLVVEYQLAQAVVL